MNTQIDWRGELDSSFGDGTDRPPADFLVPARAALRRRRTAMGAAVLASVIVVGGIGWAFAPGDDDVRGSPVASEGASPAPADNGKQERRQKRAVEKPNFLGNPATYDNNGNVVMAPGWTSVAMRAVRGGEASFVLVSFHSDADGSGTSIFSNDAVGSLSAWLEGTVASQRTLDEANTDSSGVVTAEDQSVVMNPNGEWHVFGGVRILDSRRW